jgi:hypothetical protein
VYTAADGVSVADLLHFGLDHISAAQALLNGAARHFDSAGYVAHLGFELLLKAWHLHTCSEFSGIHGLEDLWNGLLGRSRIRSLSDRDLETLRLLDSYAELRYPNLNSPVEVGSDDLPRIGALGKALFERMPKSLHAIVDGLHWSTKGGRVLMERPMPHRP